MLEFARIYEPIGERTCIGVFIMKIGEMGDYSIGCLSLKYAMCGSESEGLFIGSKL